MSGAYCLVAKKILYITTIIPTLIVQIIMNQIIIKYRFKFYSHIVCDNNKQIWQLEHFKGKRNRPFKKLTYNKDRKAYRINSQWVSSKRLLSLKIECYEVVKSESSVTSQLIKKLENAMDC